MKGLLSLLIIFSLLLSINVAFTNGFNAEKQITAPRSVGVKSLITADYQPNLTLKALEGDNSPPVLITDNNSKFKSATDLATNLQKNKDQKKDQAKEEVKKENFLKEEYIFNGKKPQRTLRL